jgi:hypothetical protein
MKPENFDFDDAARKLAEEIERGYVKLHPVTREQKEAIRAVVAQRHTRGPKKRTAIRSKRGEMLAQLVKEARTILRNFRATRAQRRPRLIPNIGDLTERFGISTSEAESLQRSLKQRIPGLTRRLREEKAKRRRRRI